MTPTYRNVIKTKTYRGKYPFRIESTFSLGPTAQTLYGYKYACRTNNGRVYGLGVVGGKLPKCGDDVHEWPQSAYLYQSILRR